MTIGPPHIYRLSGPKQRKPVDPKIIENALIQAHAVQKLGYPAILTLGHLAHLTGLPWKELRQVVTRQRDPYRLFSINKRSGGKRVICVPRPSLYRVQSWLNQEVLSRARPHWRSFAFAPNSSIFNCAREHCGCKWLIKVDIKNFFESISEKEVYKVFQGMAYQPLVSFELARLCTRVSKDNPGSRWYSDPEKYSVIKTYQHKKLGHLPQGAPTSPMLSNLVCWQLDEDLNAAANIAGLVYTRYADDLAFSTIDPSFDRKKAQHFIRKVYSILHRHHFEPQETKTVVVPPGARRLVLGLLVDSERPRLSKSFRRRVEHHIWAIGRFGLAHHALHLGFESIWGFQRHVEGLINFAHMVDADYAAQLKQDFSEALARTNP